VGTADCATACAPRLPPSTRNSNATMGSLRRRSAHTERREIEHALEEARTWLAEPRPEGPHCLA